MPEDDSSNDPLLVKWLKWLTPVFAAAAIVLYALLRLAYVQFYSPFGITPERAGLARTELLSQALIGPVVLFLLLVIVFLVLLVVLVVYFTAQVSVFWTFASAVARRSRCETDRPGWTRRLRGKARQRCGLYGKGTHWIWSADRS
jgi:hypothetical protein